MKIKIVGYSLLSLSLVLFSVHFLSKPKNIPMAHDETTLSVQNELIVAPAIIDSVADITRVPTLQSGLIKTIDVQVGQSVKKGQTLFSLDDQLAENNVLIHKITLEQAKNTLLTQKKALKHANEQLTRLRQVDSRAISQAELQEKIHEVKMTQVKLTHAQNSLNLAMANLKNAELTYNQFTTVAPKDGIVLQVNAHPNEFVGGSQPIVLLGDAKKIIVRVSLDERDTQRFDPKAVVYLTSNEDAELKIPLTFMQSDRFIVTQERLNSRVQEIMYYFNRDDYPNLVAGQQFNANISIRTSA